MAIKLPDELLFIHNSRAKQHQTDTSLKGKVCVVSGATSGVGMEAVKRFAKGGANIVMVGRNQSKAEAIKIEIENNYAAHVDMVIGDFSILTEVRRVASEILQNHPRIDVLVNSAGLHSTKRTYTSEGFETVFCVNHLSSFLLTYLLLDRMKESAPSRIIQVNSEGHRFGGLDINDLNWNKRHYTGLKGYGASKTAQLLTTWEFCDLLKGSGVTINAMHPGDVKSNIGSNNGFLYRLFKKYFINLLLKDPVISGEAIYYLAAAPELSDISGRFFHLTIDEKPAPHALDRELGKKIWDKSLQLTQIE